MNDTVKNTAADPDAADKLALLEAELLAKEYITSVDFDISHSYGKTYRVTIKIGYDAPITPDILGGKFIDGIIETVKNNGFRFTFSGMDDSEPECYIVACFDAK